MPILESQMRRRGVWVRTRWYLLVIAVTSVLLTVAQFSPGWW